MRSFYLFFALVFITPALAMNDVCQKEFVPLMQGHAAIMQSGGNLPKGKPKTYEQAVANANAHCGFLTRAQGSFSKLNTWMKKNEDFCQVKPEDLKTVSSSLATISKNRGAACNAVTQLKKQKSAAEKQAATQQQAGNPLNALQPKRSANDPFNPQIVRKPQLAD